MLILQRLPHILCIILDAVLRLVSSLLLDIGFGSLHELSASTSFKPLTVWNREESRENKRRVQHSSSQKSQNRRRTAFPFRPITAVISETCRMRLYEKVRRERARFSECLVSFPETPSQLISILSQSANVQYLLHLRLRRRRLYRNPLL